MSRCMGVKCGGKNISHSKMSMKNQCKMKGNRGGGCSGATFIMKFQEFEHENVTPDFEVLSSY